MIVVIRIDGRPVLNAELLDEDLDELRGMLADHYVSVEILHWGHLSGAEWREAQALAPSMTGVARHPLEIVRRVLRECPPERAESAETEKKKQKRLPSNPDVRDLVKLLADGIPAGKSRREIALEFTRNDEPRAQSLLREARNYRELYEPD